MSPSVNKRTVQSPSGGEIQPKTPAADFPQSCGILVKLIMDEASIRPNQKKWQSKQPSALENYPAEQELENFLMLKLQEAT